jgi:hypothetical protein
MSGLIKLTFATLLFSTLFLSCRHSKPSDQSLNPNAKLKVVFFHTRFRCNACNAIETNTKKVLIENYKTEMENGVISFASFNIDHSEYNELIEKYQVSYTSLLLIREDTAKTDFTYTAFEYAYKQPEKYAKLLKAEIDKNLK